MSTSGDHDLFALLADAASQQRDVTGLRRFAPLAEESAQGCNHELYDGVAQRALGVLHRLEGDLDQAEARLQRALALFQALGTRWQLGRTYVELGEVARARRDCRLARSHFEQALALFEEMGAVPDVAHSRQALAGL